MNNSIDESVLKPGWLKEMINKDWKKDWPEWLTKIGDYSQNLEHSEKKNG